MNSVISQRPEQITLGVVVIIATVFAMATADAVVKLISYDVPLWQIYVVRSLIVIPILLATPLLTHQLDSLRPKSFAWVSLRSLLLVLMYLAIYAAAPVLSLSVIAAALYTSPLFITLFSALLIAEPVGLRRWLAVIVGFAGVLVIIRPGTDAFSYLTLIPILAAVLYALAAIITRAKCAEEKPIVLALALNISLLLFGAVASLVIVLWQPSSAETAVYPFLLGYWTAMQAPEWSIMLLLAFLMLAISLGLAKAYQSAPPAIIATFDYSYLVFATLWGFILFTDVPDTLTIIGMILITSAGLLSMGHSSLVSKTVVSE